MPLRFRRSLKILPGIRLNLSRSGVSAAVGGRGARITVGHGRVRESVGLHGTGISYSESRALLGKRQALCTQDHSMLIRSFRAPAALLCSTLLAACGSGSLGAGTGTGGVTSPTATPGGLWRGTDPYTGDPLLGIVAETGQFTIIRTTDGAQYFGGLSTSGNSLSAAFIGVLPLGESFQDGSSYGAGSITGTFLAQQSITGSISFTTANAVALGTDPLSLTFDPLYLTGSSLAALAGTYVDPTSNTVVNISISGAVFSQDASTGCSVNGLIGLIDPAYDAYQIDFGFANCGGSVSPLNGTTATGLATLDTSVTPNVLYVGVQNVAAHYVLSAAYQRQ